jgi:hypothetical protein
MFTVRAIRSQICTTPPECLVRFATVLIAADGVVVLHQVCRTRRVAIASRIQTGRDRFRRYQSLFHPFLLLHPPVLKPDLHLGLVQLQGGRDLDPPSPCQVFVEMKLLLQLGQLLVGEVGAAGVETVQAQHARGVGAEARAARRGIGAVHRGRGVAGGWEV